MYGQGAMEGVIILPGAYLSIILTHTGSMTISDDNGGVLCLLLK